MIKDKKTTDIEFTEQKYGLDNDENDIKFRWSNVQEEEEDIAKTNAESLQKVYWWEKLFIKVTRELFDDYGIVPNEKKIKKIYFEVILYIKIFFL